MYHIPSPHSAIDLTHSAGWLVGWMVGWLHYESVHFILCRHTEYEFYDYKYVASSALNANIYGNNDHKSDHS